MQRRRNERKMRKWKPSEGWRTNWTKWLCFPHLPFSYMASVKYQSLPFVQMRPEVSSIQYDRTVSQLTAKANIIHHPPLSELQTFANMTV